MASTIVLVISTLTLAYCREIAAFFVDLFGYGGGSWDPKYSKTVSLHISCIAPGQPDTFTPQVIDTAIGFAIVSFYLLDFALNALQASLRNLLLDITPPEQLNAGNAWHSRMLNAGNIVGYGFGTPSVFPRGVRCLTEKRTMQGSCRLRTCRSYVCWAGRSSASSALCA